MPENAGTDGGVGRGEGKGTGVSQHYTLCPLLLPANSEMGRKIDGRDGERRREPRTKMLRGLGCGQDDKKDDEGHS